MRHVYVSNFIDVGTIDAMNDDRPGYNICDDAMPQAHTIALSPPDPTSGWCKDAMDIAKADWQSGYDYEEGVSDPGDKPPEAEWVPLHVDPEAYDAAAYGKTCWVWVLVKPGAKGFYDEAFVAFTVFKRELVE